MADPEDIVDLSEHDGEDLVDETDDPNYVWKGVCLDDGTGRDVYYVDEAGGRSRRQPKGYEQEYFENGDKRYYFRQKCIRCRKNKQPAVFLAHSSSSVGYSLNYCDDCHVATTEGITRTRGNGNSIWQANVDTPKNAWINLKDRLLDPYREEKLLKRSAEARYASRWDMKMSRNRQRYPLIKSEATLYEGIDIYEGKHVSWGFEEVFDEYFGDVNDKGEPHGIGLKVFSDGTIYSGGFQNGLFDTNLDNEFKKDVKGILVKPTGATYEGTFMEGMKHGMGSQTYPDGTRYEGEFAKGFEHGQGHKTYLSKEGQSSFTGRFRFGRKDGPGTMVHVDGTSEKGTFLDPAEKYTEKSCPIIQEKNSSVDDHFQPKSLVDLCLIALAKAMHANRRKFGPAPLLQRCVPEHLKPALGREYLRQLDPPGSPAFVKVGPEFAFNFLKEVLFCGVKVIEADAMALMYFQNSNKQLEVLKCTANKMTLPSIDLICINLQQMAWPILRELDLSLNTFDVPALASLTAGLRAVTSLRSLRLAACGIKAPGIHVIMDWLAADSGVTQVDLAFNTAELTGAEHVAHMLTQNTTLTELNLRSNKIGQLGGRAIAEAMKKNKVLCVMGLADNLVTGPVISDVAAKLNGTFGDCLKGACHDQLLLPSLYEEDRYNHFKKRNADKFAAMEPEDSDSD